MSQNQSLCGYTWAISGSRLEGKNFARQGDSLVINRVDERAGLETCVVEAVNDNSGNIGRTLEHCRWWVYEEVQHNGGDVETVRGLVPFKNALGFPDVSLIMMMCPSVDSDEHAFAGFVFHWSNAFCSATSLVQHIADSTHEIGTRHLGGRYHSG
ncbi:MAG: hypothetical protein AAF662_03405 [Pseudomonadota bacterium]